MTKIIGHRGARGIELENSLASIRTGLEQAPDGIEIDVHRTSDGKLVVLHDPTTGRVAERNVRINETSFADLQQLKLKNGQSIPTLEQVLQEVGSRPLYIDVKDKGCAPEFVRLLARFPEAQISFASQYWDDLRDLHDVLPDIPSHLYALKRSGPPRPFKHVREALRAHAAGIGVDKLYLNPLTYLLARHSGLSIYTYSIKSPITARILHILYPKLDFCTGQPRRLAKALGRADAG